MTLEELISAYREQAIIAGEASEVGDHKRYNRAKDELMRIRGQLREAGPEHVRRILALLDDENLFVRLAAGIDALALSPPDGERVLTAIAREPLGVAGLDAEMSLKLWRAGEFTVSWWKE